MLIREFEERLKWLVDAGVPVGAVHLYAGQEAVAVGTCAALREDDWIASTHRGHGHCIAKGVDVRPMMAEIYGKVTGTNRGKGGSMHITDVTKGILGVNPIVGAGVDACDRSWSVCKSPQDRSGMCGVLRRGRRWHRVSSRSHEHGSNLEPAGPVRLREQRYAQATPAEYAVAIQDIADRAARYGMPGEVVDGQDVDGRIRFR